LNIGLHWIRRRQRSLARGVLALVCAAWLQAAIVPCVMAHESAFAAPQAGITSHHQHDAHAGHHDGTMVAAQDAGATASPCLYCPPSGSGSTSCDGHGGCAYPHDPQVDARAAGALFAALPAATFVVHAPLERAVAYRASPALLEDIPRVRLSVCYCRFLE
jgi:hypothetical protein